MQHFYRIIDLQEALSPVQEDMQSRKQKSFMQYLSEFRGGNDAAFGVAKKNRRFASVIF